MGFTFTKDTWAGRHRRLGRGRHLRSVRLVEVADARKATILLAYRRRFGIVPFVRDAFAAIPADGPAAFDRESDRHPVFLVEHSVEQSGLRPS